MFIKYIFFLYTLLLIIIPLNLFALTTAEEQNLYTSFNNKNRKIIADGILQNSQKFYLGQADEKATKILIDKLNYNDNRYQNYYTYTFLLDSNISSSHTDYQNQSVSNLYIENKNINFGISTDNKNLSFGLGLSTTFISSKDNTESIYTLTGQNFSLNFFSSYHYENFFYIITNIQSNMSNSSISRISETSTNLSDIQDNSTAISIKLGSTDYITKTIPIFINPYIILSANKYDFSEYQETNKITGVGYQSSTYSEITELIGIKLSYKYQVNYRNLVKYILTDIIFNYQHTNPLQDLYNKTYILSNPQDIYSINSNLMNTNYSTTLNITTGSNKYISKFYISYQKNKEITSILTGFLISYYFM